MVSRGNEQTFTGRRHMTWTEVSSVLIGGKIKEKEKNRDGRESGVRQWYINVAKSKHKAKII